MSTKIPIRLLLVDDSEEDAERLVSVLRNAGIAIRPNRVQDMDQLQEIFASTPLDVVLCCLDAQELNIESISEAAGRANKDLPIIAIAEVPDGELLITALSDGAVDMVSREATEHLQHSIMRESDSLNARRNVRRLEVALREAERRCNTLLDSSRDAIAYVHEGMHVYANSAYLELFDLAEQEDIEGLPMLDMVAAEHHQDLKDALKEASKKGQEVQQLEVTIRPPHSMPFTAYLQLSQASVDSEPCCQVLLRKAETAPSPGAADQSLNRDLDLVTGLYKRQYLTSRVDAAVSRAMDGQTDQYLMFVEINEFQTITDRVGVGGADLVLGDIAELVSNHSKQEDCLARFSDHTYGLLCSCATEKQAIDRAEIIRATVEDHLSDVGKQSVSLTCSVGVTAIGEGGGSASDLFVLAGNACGKATEDGGNRFHLSNPVADEREEDQDSHWVNLIKDALKNDKFHLVFQPIVSLHGAQGEFYEVLLRMQGPKEAISPNYFLPVAERHNLLVEIDRWVITAAMKTLTERVDDEDKTTFFIKITPDSMADQSLLPWLAKQLKRYRLSGDSLVFEVPESKVVTNMKPARQFQRGLKQLHCGFALEQFGSGLNSFQLLKHLPADYLKIDRSFMLELPKNGDNQQRIREMTDQAHAAGKLTVAEFVEDAASMSVLWQCGVNFVQGNFLQEPEKILAYDFE